MVKHQIKRDSESNKFEEQAWINKHFNELINKHGGKHLIICEGELFIGEDVKELCEEAKSKYPKAKLTSMPIPRKEDLLSILIICPNP